MYVEMLDLVREEVNKQIQNAVDAALITAVMNLMKNSRWNAMARMKLPLSYQIRYSQ